MRIDDYSFEGFQFAKIHFCAVFSNFPLPFIVLRPATGSGTRWMIRWYIPVTSRSCSISRLMSSFTWGRTKPVYSHAVIVLLQLEEISEANVESLCCRIPEKKNTDSSSVKQNLVHSGRSNMTPEQLKKIPLNGPLSSPQITKVHHYCDQ